MQNKSIKLWALAFAVAVPLGAVLTVCDIALGDWLPRQGWIVGT